MHGAPKYGPGFTSYDYANPDAPKGGELKIGKTGTFNNLNKNIILGSTPDEGLEYVNDTLMARAWNEPFTLYGLVAESVDIAPDRSWIEFHLNKSARFHDGAPMTAEDVKFSFESYKKYGHPVRRRVYGLVSKVEMIGKYDIKFTFGKGYDRECALILALMPVLPRHYWEERDVSKTTLEPPLGSGPYKIAAVDPGRRIVFERVKDYWGKDLPVNRGLYNFDVITYNFYRDDSVALEAFKAGDTTIRREYDIKKWNTAYDYPALREGKAKREEIVHHRPEWLKALIFNRRRPLFQDRRVRAAMGMMFNYGWIDRSIYFNAFRITASTFPNSELAATGKPEGAELSALEPFRTELPPEVFGEMWTPPLDDARENEKKAVALLKEAGCFYKDEKLLDPKGRPFAFEILVGDPNDEKLALELARSLKKIGIDARVRTVDSAQFTGRLRDFDYDMVSFKWLNSLSPGNEQLNYWGSVAADARGSRNYVGVKSVAVDALAASIAASPDRGTLVARAHALDRVLMWGHYFIPLFYSGKDRVAFDAALAHPDTVPVYGNVLETWWRKP
jgi:microcin C transport system substrate-binding protein